MQHEPTPQKLSIIGRERALIDALTKELHKSLTKHAKTDPFLGGRRHGSFEVLIHHDGEPTGHVARVTVELDRLDPDLVKKFKAEQGRA